MIIWSKTSAYFGIIVVVDEVEVYVSLNDQEYHFSSSFLCIIIFSPNSLKVFCFFDLLYYPCCWKCTRSILQSISFLSVWWFWTVEQALRYCWFTSAFRFLSITSSAISGDFEVYSQDSKTMRIMSIILCLVFFINENKFFQDNIKFQNTRYTLISILAHSHDSVVFSCCFWGTNVRKHKRNSWADSCFLE